MTTAIVRTDHGKAVFAFVPFVADARPVVAVPVQRAGVRARSHGAVYSNKTWITVALKVILFGAFGAKRTPTFPMV